MYYSWLPGSAASGNVCIHIYSLYIWIHLCFTIYLNTYTNLGCQGRSKWQCMYANIEPICMNTHIIYYLPEYTYHSWLPRSIASGNVFTHKCIHKYCLYVCLDWFFSIHLPVLFLVAKKRSKWQCMYIHILPIYMNTCISYYLPEYTRYSWLPRSAASGNVCMHI